MIERLVGGADGFTAGAPQHDDMTLVLVKSGVRSGGWWCCERLSQ
jgi:hypothetical protein